MSLKLLLCCPKLLRSRPTSKWGVSVGFAETLSTVLCCLRRIDARSQLRNVGASKSRVANLLLSRNRQRSDRKTPRTCARNCCARCRRWPLLYVGSVQTLAPTSCGFAQSIVAGGGWLRSVLPNPLLRAARLLPFGRHSYG